MKTVDSSSAHKLMIEAGAFELQGISGVSLAYQLARPELGRGVIFAFRRQDCETAAFRVTPELEKGVRYVLEDIEGGKSVFVTGGEPFDIAIADKRGSRLIMYRKATRAGTSAANSI